VAAPKHRQQGPPGDQRSTRLTSAVHLNRAREFYPTALGLTLIGHSDFACVFDAHGTMLRITAAAEVATPGYTVLGWRVGDITTTISQLTDRGVLLAHPVQLATAPSPSATIQF
jgi:hypothetical protein